MALWDCLCEHERGKIWSFATSSDENEDRPRTSFTVIASMGCLQAYQCMTGQRQLWLLRLEIPRPEDFNRPGHVLPLKYREGGVLKRAGHTEASVDLAVFANLWQFSL